MNTECISTKMSTLEKLGGLNTGRPLHFKNVPLSTHGSTPMITGDNYSLPYPSPMTPLVFFTSFFLYSGVASPPVLLNRSSLSKGGGLGMI